MGILDGKKLLITGVLTDDSLAFDVARIAQDEGASVILTGFGRGKSLTERTARKLPQPCEVLELDVQDPSHAPRVAEVIAERHGHLDGLLHAIGFAPSVCLGQGMMPATWEDVSTMLEISTYSLKYLSDAFAPLLGASGNGSIVALDFDATQAWPGYDWMGVAKAGLESLTRYLARDLGGMNIRVNLVAAGPIRTMAAKSIPGFSTFEEIWEARAPLGWNMKTDGESVARACVALFSDWFPRTTGDMIHVDGGFHAVGA